MPPQKSDGFDDSNGCGIVGPCPAIGQANIISSVMSLEIRRCRCRSQGGIQRSLALIGLQACVMRGLVDIRAAEIGIPPGL